MLIENVIVWLLGLTTAFLIYMFILKTNHHLKYNPEEQTISFMLEETVRSSGGIVVLTFMQIILWKTNCLNPSPEIPSMKEFLLWVIFIAQWNDFHFYAGHWMLHSVPFLYRNVHKVHHKSYNTNPASGLSMHQVEHVIYFSAILIALVVPLPFWVVRVLSVNLIVYPLPEHIGMAPFAQHHWFHHTQFTFNYGSS